jgi:tetratricopeptide (TPR) repeat protein
MTRKTLLLWAAAMLFVLSLTPFAPLVFAQENCDASVDYLKLGNDQYAAGNYDQAIASFTCAITQHPGSAAAYNARGNAYRNLEQYPKAIDSYSRAIQLDGNFAIAYNNRGWSYYKIAQYQAALADFNRAIEIDPHLAYAFNNRGLIHQILRDFPLAIDDFNTAIQLGYEPVSDVQFNLKQVTFERDKLEAGGTTVGNTTSTTTNTTSNLLAQADQLYNQQDFAKAADAYGKVLEQDPSNAEALFRRAYSYGEAGDYQKSIDDYNKLLQVGYSPLSWVYNNLGYDYSQMNNEAQAVPQYDKALELDPTYAQAAFNRAYSYGRLGQYQKAIDDVNLALKLNFSDTALAYNNRGWYYQQLNDNDQAMADYDQALTTDPNYGLALRNRGSLFGIEGNYQKGIADYDLAIQIEPDVADAYLTRGYLKSFNNDMLGAAQDYSEWIKRIQTQSTAENAIKPGDTLDLNMTQGLIYRIPLKGESGQVVNVTATGSGNVDPLVVLLDPSGAPVAGSDDTSATDVSAAIADFKLPVNGDYTLLVTHAGGGSEGTITLKLLGELTAQELMDRASNYDSNVQYDLAIADYTRVIALDPGNATAYFSRGYDYGEQNKSELAISDYTNAIELKYTPVAWAYNNRGVEYHNLNELDKAIADYTRAIEADPTYANAYVNRGLAYYDKKDYQSAIKDYSNAIEYAYTPLNDAYYDRGLAQDAAGNYDLAITDYTKAIEIAPNDPNAYVSRGLAYYDKKDYESAIKDFSSGIEYAYTPLSDAYLDRGLAQDAAGNYDLAITDYSKAIELNPNDPSAYVNRGFAYYDEKDYENAIKDFSSGIDHAYTPLNDAYLDRGLAQEAAGKHDLAVADYSKAIEIAPNDQHAYGNRGDSYLGLQQWDKAVSDYDKAIQIDSTQAGNYLGRGIANNQLGKPADAAKDFYKWISLNQKTSTDNPALKSGGSITVKMSDGQVYRIPFSGKAGESVTITATGAKPSNDAEEVDPLIVILGPDGAPLIGDDDGGGGLNSAIKGFALPADGSYTLLVSHAGGGTEGDITVKLDITTK